MRGMGLMQAMELVESPGPKEPSPRRARAVSLATTPPRGADEEFESVWQAVGRPLGSPTSASGSIRGDR